MTVVKGHERGLGFKDVNIQPCAINKKAPACTEENGQGMRSYCSSLRCGAPSFWFFLLLIAGGKVHFRPG